MVPRPYSTRGGSYTINISMIGGGFTQDQAMAWNPQKQNTHTSWYPSFDNETSRKVSCILRNMLEGRFATPFHSLSTIWFIGHLSIIEVAILGNNL